MSPWAHGSHEIDTLLGAGTLQRVTGADVGTASLMGRAGQLLSSAEDLLHKDPVTAYIVAYDGAKHAGAALLAEQNLRATDHVTIERVLATQFGPPFSRFRNLRRRRNELDYPSSADDFADQTEAQKAIGYAREIVDNAARILEQGILTVYRPDQTPPARTILPPAESHFCPPITAPVICRLNPVD